MDIAMGTKIRDRRKQLGYTIKEVAERAGTSPASLTKWERGDVKTIKSQKLAKLASVLDCSPLWLMGLEEDPLMTPNIEPIPEGKRIPVLGEIACGAPILAEENWAGEVQGPASADFCLRARGDSMINARIFPGDLVFIKQQPDVENGEIAAVLIGGEATLKRVYKYGDRIELRPENPLYKVIQIEGSGAEDFQIIGKAVSLFSTKL